MKSLPLFLKAPARVAIAVGLIVLVIDLSIMLLISGVTEESSLDAWYFVDPLLLTALVSPALYTLIFRPMRNQQVEIERQLDLDAVDRFLRMAEITQLPGATAAVEGVINMQGEVVPVVSTGDVASASLGEESQDARFQTQ